MTGSDLSAVGKEAKTTQAYKLTFTGNGIEYFKIWLSNLVLTIITLGIYSAWAKVRKKRYFYGNTHLDNNTFDYTADPVAILKGRLVAVAIFVVYAVTIEVMPVTELGWFLAFILVLPWLLIRSLRFNNNNSVYRGVRFGFAGSYKGAFVVIVVMSVLTGLTLGLLFPLFQKMRYKYIIDNSKYGTSTFDNTTSASVFYLIYFVALLLYIFIGILFLGLQFILPMVGLGGLMVFQTQELAGAGVFFVLFLLVFIFLAAYEFVYAYVTAETRNHVYADTTLGKCRLQSDLSATKLTWLLITNSLAIIFTLGLLYPWSIVRMYRYKTENTSVLVTGAGLEEFINEEREQQGKISEGLSDVFDVDVGI